VRIMLVDDHHLLRQSLKRQLEDLGYEVVADVADGTSAISIALNKQPDIILMDISMAGGDGISACRAIMEADARQRIVMLTMHVETDLIRKSLKAGAIGYLTKDATFDEVLKALEMACDGDVIISPEFAHALLDETDDMRARQESILSEREMEVLQLLADGQSTPEIAGSMFISQKTVKNHLASIYEKIDARDRTHAVIRAVKMGIIKIGP
jgi:DNA-binding NarL/FixJ family response regulator